METAYEELEQVPVSAVIQWPWALQLSSSFSYQMGEEMLSWDLFVVNDLFLIDYNFGTWNLSKIAYNP